MAHTARAARAATYHDPKTLPVHAMLACRRFLPCPPQGREAGDEQDASTDPAWRAFEGTGDELLGLHTHCKPEKQPIKCQVTPPPASAAKTPKHARQRDEPLPRLAIAPLVLGRRDLQHVTRLAWHCTLDHQCTTRGIDLQNLRRERGVLRWTPQSVVIRTLSFLTLVRLLPICPAILRPGRTRLGVAH